MSERTDIKINVQPNRKVLLGEQIIIEVSGLQAQEKVTVHARRIDNTDNLWYSRAVYEADAKGSVTNIASPAVEGSYSGVDPAGLFWSMVTLRNNVHLEEYSEKLTPIADTEIGKDILFFDIEVGARIIGSARVEVVKALADVQCEQAKEEGLAANFYYPKGKKDLPVIILVSGSEGGIAGQDHYGSILASHGYATLALAYFGLPGLPVNLERIPLEYFEKAIRWVKKQRVVDPDKVVVMGWSKGGELALLLGSYFPEVRGVIAISPAHVVFQGVNMKSFHAKSSWSYHKKSLPYVPLNLWESAKVYYQISIKKKKKQVVGLPVYEASLNNESAVRDALIEVEKINGPVLLISGGDDQMWPAHNMCEAVVQRLRENSFAHGYQHLAHPEGGHMVIGPGYSPTTYLNESFFALGGSPEGNGRAQVKSWQYILEFLANNFPKPE